MSRDPRWQAQRKDPSWPSKRQASARVRARAAICSSTCVSDGRVRLGVCRHRRRRHGLRGSRLLPPRLRLSRATAAEKSHTICVVSAGHAAAVHAHRGTVRFEQSGPPSRAAPFNGALAPVAPARSASHPSHCVSWHEKCGGTAAGNPRAFSRATSVTNGSLHPQIELRYGKRQPINQSINRQERKNNSSSHPSSWKGR